MTRLVFCAFAAAVLGLQAAAAPRSSLLAQLDGLYPSLDALYQDLHRQPELSGQEQQTAVKLAAGLQEVGFEVTPRIGGNGIVGVLRNGEGPTILVRTDMDALPIMEMTGLPYASKATGRLMPGAMGPVMHACGHDIHMVSWLGAATLLAQAKDQWRGTLVFVGQPAEETTSGAQSMIDDGLFTRFPKPDYALAIHVTNVLPAGQVGVIPGPASAASNAVDVTFYGKGGHGAAPHRAIDPILMASRAVVAFQGIVSREINPFEPAVVTVGTFHAGAKRNIIPEKAELELTIRSYSPEVQKKILAAIERIAKAEAAASGAPREPVVFIDPKEASEVVVNDPKLAARAMVALRAHLGEANVYQIEPVMTSEDFGVYGHKLGIPSLQLRVGAIEPRLFAELKEKGQLAPGVHTPYFAPDRERTIRTGVAAFTLTTLDLLTGPAFAQ